MSEPDRSVAAGQPSKDGPATGDQAPERSSADEAPVFDVPSRADEGLIEHRMQEAERRLTDVEDAFDARRRDVVIAVIAAIAAFLSAVAGIWFQVRAENRQRAEDVQDERSDLRAILQELTTIPGQEAGASERVAADLNTKRRLLVGQAVGIVEGFHERSPNRTEITSAEYATLAEHLAFLGAYDRAREYLDAAVAGADSLVDASTALRSQAQLRFLAGQELAGRRLFRQTLALGDRYDDGVAFYLDFVTVDTRLFWAELELGRSNCAVGRAQLRRAEQIAARQSVARSDRLKRLNDELTACEQRRQQQPHGVVNAPSQ